MSSSQNILTAFNDHFMEFVEDIRNIFPEDKDIGMAKTAFQLIRRANPKMIIKVWKSYIVDKYQDKVDAGDLTFFTEKDYSGDLQNAENSDKIMEAINRLRNPIKMMNPEDQAKTMKYIQNLTKLCNIYHG
jgi:hypothetical protein